MKCKLIALVLISAFITPAIAGEPEGKGKGKPAAEQKAMHPPAMQAQENRHQMEKETPEKMQGLQKQADKKSTQIQKEMDKGSDKGKETREEKRKKWWKFWDD